MASRCGLGRPGSLQRHSADLSWRPAVYQASGMGDSHGPKPGASAVGSLEEIVQSGRLT